MLAGTGAAVAWAATGGLHTWAQTPMLKNMGGEPPGFGHRSRAGNFDILEHCRSLGLGAMNLPSPDLDAVRQLRKKVQSYGMRVIISLAPPKRPLKRTAGLSAAEALKLEDEMICAVDSLGAQETQSVAATSPRWYKPRTTRDRGLGRGQHGQH